MNDELRYYRKIDKWNKFLHTASWSAACGGLILFMRLILHNSALNACVFVGEYAESPKGLKVGDRVKVDVDVQRLEELQRQRDAWDPELAKVRSSEMFGGILNWQR